MIGIFGGTFDPVHFGHLRCAWEVADQLELREVRMLPCGNPPHRAPPLASVEQRVQALKLALEGQSLLRLDTREIDREGPSYMVDTLVSLRAELPDSSLCLILGQDAFNGLDSWHRWEVVPTLAHLVVITRPGVEPVVSGQLAQLVEERSVESLESLRAMPCGGILFRTVTSFGYSGTCIRRLLASGRSPRYLLPCAVLEYLEREQVYSNLN